MSAAASGTESDVRSAWVWLGFVTAMPILACRDKRAAPPGTGFAYVSEEESGDVVVVDTVRAEVVARVPVGTHPRGLEVSRDGSVLYVATAQGIAVVDVATRKVVRTLPGGEDPSFGTSPDGKIAFVSSEKTAELSAIDLASGAIRGTVHVGRAPQGVAVRPDGKVVFVASREDDEVTVVDAATLAVLAHPSAGQGPRSIVFAKDGLTAFVMNELARTVTVLDGTRYEAIASIPVHEDSPMPSGARPASAALSPDGGSLYVSCGRGGSVAIVDVAKRTQVRSIDGAGDRPWGIALSPDGSRLYTANGPSHDVSIVNVATGNVDKRVFVGGSPWGVVLGR
jgi:YVTN family beta-propeller protein